MWGATLSRPLPIIDLVSRYLTNYLIGRTPILYRPKPLMLPYYGVFTPFPVYVPQYKVGSVRVTHPCAGRHQEQAPMLPLDLHVLSLPLAFILSQDQTLHSISS